MYATIIPWLYQLSIYYIQEGDVAELFALPGPATSTNTTATTHLDKTWSAITPANTLLILHVVLAFRSKSDLSTTIKEISALGKNVNCTTV